MLMPNVAGVQQPRTNRDGRRTHWNNSESGFGMPSRQMRVCIVHVCVHVFEFAFILVFRHVKCVCMYVALIYLARERLNCEAI